MTDLSNYLENAWLKTLAGTPFTNVTPYVQLHTGAPGEDGTSNVATETNREIATFNVPAGSTMTNSTASTWSAVAATETYSHLSIWDASTSGNCLWQGSLTASVGVNAGDDFEIAAGNLSLALD